jgi:hypothetical protein
LVVTQNTAMFAKVTAMRMNVEHGRHGHRANPGGRFKSHSVLGLSSDGKPAATPRMPSIRRILRRRPFNGRKRNLVSSSGKTVSVVFPSRYARVI